MPRIFIAIQFPDEFRQKLVSIQNALRQRGVAGNFCPLGNLHLMSDRVDGELKYWEV